MIIEDNVLISIDENDIVNGHLDIPEGVVEIGEGVCQMHSFKTVTLPDSIAKIGSDAFNNCGLTSITFPKSVVEIEEYAFYGNKLTDKVILDTIRHIGECAFHDNEIDEVALNGKNYKVYMYLEGQLLIEAGKSEKWIEEDITYCTGKKFEMVDGSFEDVVLAEKDDGSKYSMYYGIGSNSQLAFEDLQTRVLESDY